MLFLRKGRELKQIIVEGKKNCMISREIRKGIWYVGIWDGIMRGFSGTSYMPSGLRYNSYLLDTQEGFILIGTMPENFLTQWLIEMKRIIGEGKIGWMVLLDSSCDRAAVKALLQVSSDIVLIGGSNALYKVSDEAGTEAKRIEVRSHRTLAFGCRRLRFQVVAERFDTASVYVIEDKERIMFTADAFGSIYTSDEILVSEINEKEVYFKGATQYFTDISETKRKKSFEEAAALVQEGGITMICPMRGAVADCGLERLVGIFLPGIEEKTESLMLGILYYPEKYVNELAKCIENGIRDSGNINVEKYNLAEMDRGDVINRLSRCNACLFGTAQAGEDAAKPVWDILTSLNKEDYKDKPAAVFTSYDTRNDAAVNIRQRLAMLGFDPNLQDFQMQGKPDRHMLKNAYEYGFGIGCSILKIPNTHKPPLVKCLVCGEIFDASLGICPVCGVGLEQCVSVDGEDVALKRNTNSNYIILGGGIAAVSAAEAIRIRDETGRIEIFSAEADLPINRPILTKDFEKAIEQSESIYIHEREWYDERNIILHTSCHIAVLDTDSKTVTADTGERFHYDKLIYAMGAECFIPPFEGSEKKGVLTIRHLSDVKRLYEYIKKSRKAVVIGGGVLGLEAASELMRSGILVTVLEASPQIIERQTDSVTAALIKSKMLAMNVTCYEGVSIAGIEGGSNVSGVRLKDGMFFPADFVIVSCGNKGNVQIAREAGITVDRSIVVNEYMETNKTDVYACGDCAQFDGINYQLWQEASGQGRVAGANAAGEHISYAHQMLGLSLEGFGTSLFAIGDAGKRTDIPYRIVEISDNMVNRHEKYWFFGNSLQGANLVGTTMRIAEITRAVTEHAGYDELF